MAETHPESLGELAEWMREDAEVNRRRGGGIFSVIAVAIFRLNQFGICGSGLASKVVLLLSVPLLVFSRLLLGCEVSGSLACGRRFVLAHGGRGVIIVPDAVIGGTTSWARTWVSARPTPGPVPRSWGTASASAPT